MRPTRHPHRQRQYFARPQRIPRFQRVKAAQLRPRQPHTLCQRGDGITAPRHDHLIARVRDDAVVIRLGLGARHPLDRARGGGRVVAQVPIEIATIAAIAAIAAATGRQQQQGQHAWHGPDQWVRRPGQIV